MPSLSELDDMIGVPKGYSAYLRRRGVIQAEPHGAGYRVQDQDVASLASIILEYRQVTQEPLPEQGYYTVQAAARVLDIKPATIYNAVSQGKVPVVHIRDRILLAEEVVEAWRLKRIRFGLPRVVRRIPRGRPA